MAPRRNPGQKVDDLTAQVTRLYADAERKANGDTTPLFTGDVWRSNDTCIYAGATGLAAVRIKPGDRCK